MNFSQLRRVVWLRRLNDMSQGRLTLLKNHHRLGWSRRDYEVDLHALVMLLKVNRRYEPTIYVWLQIGGGRGNLCGIGTPCRIPSQLPDHRVVGMTTQIGPHTVTGSEAHFCKRL
jgi:hypothetical protein